MDTGNTLRKNRRSGFTLVEVLTASMLLGIVIAIVFALFRMNYSMEILNDVTTLNTRTVSMAMEQMVYGEPGGQQGLRGATNSTVSIQTGNGAWKINYNNGRWIMYEPGSQRIFNEDGYVFISNVESSKVEAVSGGLNILISQEMQKWRRKSSTSMETFVQFRN